MGKMKGGAVGLRMSIKDLLDRLEIADDSDIIMNADMLEDLGSRIRDISIVRTFFMDD